MADMSISGLEDAGQVNLEVLPNWSDDSGV
jgi:hypothetical protein